MDNWYYTENMYTGEIKIFVGLFEAMRSIEGQENDYYSPKSFKDA